MQEDRNYIVFILGYDLLQNQFLNSKEPECDLVYDKCTKIADDFLKSKYNVNSKSLYDCVVDYIDSERFITFKKLLEIKTLEGWEKSKINTFDEYCKPGDIVDQNMVNYFLDLLPPLIFGEHYIQVGGAYNDILDKEDNLIKPTYMTFDKEDGNWIYKGNCFKGKNIDMSYMNDQINDSKYKSGYIEKYIKDKIEEMNTTFNFKLNIDDKLVNKVLEKVREDDEFIDVIDESIASAIVEINEKKLSEENDETNGRE